MLKFLLMPVNHFPLTLSPHHIKPFFVDEVKHFSYLILYILQKLLITFCVSNEDTRIE